MPFLMAEQASNIRLDVSGGGAAPLTQIGLGKIAFKHAEGYAEVVADPFCPLSDCYLLNERSWGLQYLGDSGDDFVDFVKNERGGIVTQAYNAAGVESRVESFGNLVCDMPGANVRFNLSSALITRILGASGSYNA